MYDVLIIRYGEIGLKGQNKHDFIGQLIRNIDNAVTDLGDFEITTVYGRIYLHVDSESLEKVTERLTNVPGIVSISPAVTVKFDFEVLNDKALELFKREVADYPTTFKVNTRRADKSFPLESPEINSELGACILRNVESPERELNVDVHNPEHLLEVEIRRGKIYIFIKRFDGPGGLPVKSSGKALLLLSGGIDSPVAGWLGLKRGLSIDAVYFHSFPYTGDRTKEKVADLSRVLSRYGGNIKLHIAYFTEIQQEIAKNCPERYTVTIMRRMMFRIANKIAEQNNDLALITGESLGQVASQTLEGIASSDDVAELPVLRPLITMDKNEIVDISKKIDCYDISIRPYEDCCTVFVPNNPVTRPKIDRVRRAEENLNIDKLIKNAVEKTEIMHINQRPE
ncbi:MAG: tRNA uracil 4-sulfurtransferase ThiI [Bacillota bacterium]